MDWLQSSLKAERGRASNVNFSGKSSALVSLLRVELPGKNLSSCVSLWAVENQVWEGPHEMALLW